MNRRQIRTRVVILGAGTAGMGAAYALMENDVDFAIAEREPSVGGTAVRAWVCHWIEGIMPPYLERIFDGLSKTGGASGSREGMWLSSRFRDPGSPAGGIIFRPDALGKRYLADLGACPKARLLLNTELVSAETSGKTIRSVLLRDRITGEETEIRADFFIDSSGGELADRAGAGFYTGEDPWERFHEPLMRGRKSSPGIMNEPSLCFRTVPGSPEIGKGVPPEWFHYNGYRTGSLVNPMSGCGLAGAAAMAAGPDETWKILSSRNPVYWSFALAEYLRRTGTGEPTWGFSRNDLGFVPSGENAPMAGIREGRRILCRKMLTEQNLVRQLDSSDLQDFIASAGHDVDFHIYGSIDFDSVQTFNAEKRRPSGIPYLCLVPTDLDNLWTACRAYGASHIALAACRVNADMAQFGWAAGHAAAFCCRRNLAPADADPAELQELTGFRRNAAEQCRRMRKS